MMSSHNATADRHRLPRGGAGRDGDALRLFLSLCRSFAVSVCVPVCVCVGDIIIENNEWYVFDTLPLSLRPFNFTFRAILSRRFKFHWQKKASLALTLLTTDKKQQQALADITITNTAPATTTATSTAPTTILACALHHAQFARIVLSSCLV